jgi:hypothetical protein
MNRGSVSERGKRARPETVQTSVEAHLAAYPVGLPVSVAARSKAWVCGRSPAGIVGSNPTWAWMFVCY